MASVILRFSKQKGNPATKIEAITSEPKRNTKAIPTSTLQRVITISILSHHR